MKAPEILKQAAKHIEDRAAARDQPEGERSMGKTVEAFNAVTGHRLSERDGWVFMQILKLARACNTPAGLPDDYEDAAAYSALAGEAASMHDARSIKEARIDLSKLTSSDIDALSKPGDVVVAPFVDRRRCPENHVCDYCQLGNGKPCYES